MKNLELSNLKIQELTVSEMNEINGGYLAEMLQAGAGAGVDSSVEAYVKRWLEINFGG